VSLDPKACAGRGRDGTAWKDVVGEDQVGREAALHGARIRVDVAGTLDRRQVLEFPRLQSFVLVEYEDG
jgi:hypothetical protein